MKEPRLSLQCPWGVCLKLKRRRITKNFYSCGNYTYEDYGKAGSEGYLDLTSKWSNLMKNASKINWTTNSTIRNKLCYFFLEPTVITRRFVGVLLTFSVFRVKMNRLFGRGTPKAPPPNLSDCVANVDSRAESVDKKIARLDAELRKYKVWAALLWIATPSLTSSLATTMTTTKNNANYKNNFDDSTTNLSL